MSRLLSTLFKLATTLCVIASVLASTGCANLDAVRGFTSNAALLSAYPETSRLYKDSASSAAIYDITPPGSQPAAQRPEARQQQAQAVAALQDSLSQYFATLASLSGENVFSLEQQINHVKSGLESLPDGTVNADTLNAATSLLKIVLRYAALAYQSHEVKNLIREGGPQAMKLTAAIQSIMGDWKMQVKNDGAMIINQLEDLGVSRETNPILKNLSKDRAAQYRQQYAASDRKLSGYASSLASIRGAHAEMEKHLNDLSGEELKALLKTAQADLKQVQANLNALR
jgi:hypothetical protein